MTGDRYDRLVSLCDQAAGMGATEREAWFIAQCPDDVSLAREAMEMLAYDHERSDLDGRALPTGVSLHDWIDSPEMGDRLASTFPEKIGRYRILSILGEGGMSIVYRAQQESPRRDVALKVLRDIHASPRRMKRLRMEAQTLATLRRPDVAQVYEAGAADVGGFTIVYIAMELVEGDRLDQYVARHELDVRRCAQLMKRVCNAIEEAHQMGVVHRDLKPANILVEQRDGECAPKIVDFGVARILGGDQPDALHMTTRQELVGTLPYMSPEQFGGDDCAVDTRTDVYALGVILYELLVGRPPLDLSTDTMTKALQRIRTERPAPISSSDPALPADLSAIVSKALEKDPVDRYPSAGAMRDDLDRFLEGRPVLARAPRAAYIFRKFIGRHRIAATLTVLILGAITLGGVAASIGMLRYQTIAHRLLAEQDASRQSAEFLVTDVVRQLDAVAGSSSIKQTMLPRLRKRIEELLATAPDDETLLSIDAKVLDEISDLDLKANKLDESLMCRRRALELRQTLLAHQPDNPDRLADVSIAMVKVGDIDNGKYDYVKALRWYTQAFEIDDRLVQEHPDSRRFADNLSWSYNRLAFNAQARHEPREAEAWLTLRINLAQTIVNRFPENLTAQRGLIDAKANRAKFYWDTGDQTRALTLIKSAMLLAEDLLPAASNDPFVIDEYLMVANDLASYLVEAGQLEYAESFLQKVLPHAEYFLKLESGEAPLVRVITLLGAASQTATDPREGLARAARAVDILHERWGDAPTTPPQAYWFISVHQVYAANLIKSGDSVGAIRQTKLAIGYARTGHDMLPAQHPGFNSFASLDALQEQLQSLLAMSDSAGISVAPTAVEGPVPFANENIPPVEPHGDR